MFEKIDKFIWDIRGKSPSDLSDIPGIELMQEVMTIESLEDLVHSDKLDCTDEVTNFLIDNAEEVDDGVIEHEGCDEVVYPACAAETTLAATLAGISTSVQRVMDFSLGERKTSEYSVSFTSTH